MDVAGVLVGIVLLGREVVATRGRAPMPQEHVSQS
jgi:hypothetical protein